MRQTWILNIFWFVYGVGFFTIISGSLANAALNRGNVIRCLEILGQTLPLTYIGIKYFFFKMQIKPMKHLLKIIENDWKIQNKNSPNDINTFRSRQIMVTHARWARIFFNIFISVVITCSTLYVIEPITKKTSSNHTTNSLQYPLNSWYPLPTDPGLLYQVKLPFFYCISHFKLVTIIYSYNRQVMYTVETVFATGLAIVHVCIDSLLLAAVLHFCGQFEILRFVKSRKIYDD